VKFNSLRTSVVGSAFAIAAAFLLGSCGGGGSATQNTGGNLTLLPQSGAVFYAGMPATMTVVGGRHPYRVVSGAPGIFPVPEELNSNSFTVIPNNPGVIDPGGTVDTLPVRTVIVSVTDAENGFQQSSIQIAQNFFTGYGVTYTSNCASSVGGTTAPPACAGGETAVRIEANFNGALIGFRTYRLDVLRGPFQWLFPNSPGQIAGNSITVTTDHEGKTNAIFRVNPNVTTQIAVFRITDVETGVSTEQVFTITGVAAGTALEILPDTFTFTGPDTATCGTGTADFLVFDGTPPYTAVSSFSNVTVTPSTTSAQPGRFTLSVNDSSTCLTDATIIISDSNNVRGTVTVTTQRGDADPPTPPPAPLRVVPNSVTITCNQDASALLVSSATTPTYSAVSSDPDITFTLGPSNITVHRVGNLPASGGNKTSTVTITDGTSTAPLTVRSPVTCS
jgi:hypothetical protein